MHKITLHEKRKAHFLSTPHPLFPPSTCPAPSVSGCLTCALDLFAVVFTRKYCSCTSRPLEMDVVAGACRPLACWLLPRFCRAAFQYPTPPHPRNPPSIIHFLQGCSRNNRGGGVWGGGGWGWEMGGRGTRATRRWSSQERESGRRRAFKYTNTQKENIASKKILSIKWQSRIIEFKVFCITNKI